MSQIGQGDMLQNTVQIPLLLMTMIFEDTVFQKNDNDMITIKHISVLFVQVRIKVSQNCVVR